jgi:hypothetical protein
MRKVTAILLATAIGLAMAVPAANAFNPQPDPPGKSKTQLNKRVTPVAAKAMIVDGGKSAKGMIIDGCKTAKGKSGRSSGAESVCIKEVDPSPQGKLKTLAR